MPPSILIVRDPLTLEDLRRMARGQFGEMVYDRMHRGWPLPEGRIDVPTGYAEFPREILRPPRAWAERAFDLRRWTRMPRGGHFAALEQPDVLTEDVRAFFRPLRGS